MVIGVCKISLLIDEAFSLKQKRHVVKSVVEKIKARFNVSVAEVDCNDKWQKAVIGLTCVSNEAAHADSVMAAVVNFVECDARAVMLDYSTEIIYVE